jgi:chaperonin GroES
MIYYFCKENYMTPKVLRNRIIVSKDEAIEKLASGLYVPGNTDEKVVTGTVLSVGSGHLSNTGLLIPLEVKANDRVVFNKNMATEVKVDSQTYWILSEDQILCVLP